MLLSVGAVELDVEVRPEDAEPAAFGRATQAPWVVASLDFQMHPRSLHIIGVRRENRLLFAKLDEIDDPGERGLVFDRYMNLKFHLEDWSELGSRSRQSLRNSYLRFLRGWGVDSNSIEGAVLKGWVESRFGIAPSYHRGPVRRGTASYLPFASDRMRGQARTNAIDSQLDLLFEFCQFEVRRRRLGRLVLYRGTHDVDRHRVLRQFTKRDYVVELNNLCSFTIEPERAWEFGSTVWRVEVPLQRVCYFPGLLPRSVLRGEDEYLVLGGQHRVTEVTA
jgi:NAD+--dinitrogen-reductase ADP-D-ribosyltransferase